MTTSDELTVDQVTAMAERLWIEIDRRESVLERCAILADLAAAERDMRTTRMLRRAAWMARDRLDERRDRLAALRGRFPTVVPVRRPETIFGAIDQ